MDLKMMGGWRFIITVHGEQFVMTIGTKTMLVLSADSLVLKMLSVLTLLVGEVGRFGLTMLIVQVMSHRYFRADMGEWEFTTVLTVKTRGFTVEALKVRINHKNLNIFMNGICKYAAAKEIVFKRQFFSMSRICNEKCSKPKIFLAFLSKLLCFSFVL
jgi:hypothetical protein